MSAGDRIVTRLHRIREALPPGCMMEMSDEGIINPEVALYHLTILHDESAPVYFLNYDVLEMAASESAHESIAALIAMKLARLPFPAMIIEYHSDDNGTVVALLHEEAEPYELDIGSLGHVQTANGEGTKLTKIEVNFTVVLVMQNPEGEVAVSPVYVVDTTGRFGPFLITTPMLRPMPKKLFDARMPMISLCMLMVKTAVKALLLAMTTEGISKQRSTPPEKLNKVRKKRGKPAIPTCTVLHLSHYHDRSGKRHSVETGRHVRLHLRAGHIRNQVCGPGNKDHKKIFIKPVVVNYHPDQPVQAPVRDVRI